MTHQHCTAVNHEYGSLTGGLSNIAENMVDLRYLCGERGLWMFQVGNMASTKAETYTHKHIQKERRLNNHFHNMLNALLLVVVSDRQNHPNILL